MTWTADKPKLAGWYWYCKSVGFILMMATLVFITGCQSDPVHLRHPQTGEIRQCGPYDKNLGYRPHETRSRTWEDAEGDCIKILEAKGYELIKKKERNYKEVTP